jgi:two-component system, chemotaxis family, chemotaxis protein CheY
MVMPRPTNVLIVDDEAHVRTFVRLILRELGITECWEAADGQDAWQQIHTHKPELVLLDINLPKLSGMELLTKLHEEGSAVPVVMMTSQTAVTTVSEAMRLGAVGYLLKHSPKEQTIEMLRDILDSFDEEDEEEEAGEAQP